MLVVRWRKDPYPRGKILIQEECTLTPPDFTITIGSMNFSWDRNRTHLLVVNTPESTLS